MMAAGAGARSGKFFPRRRRLARNGFGNRTPASGNVHGGTVSWSGQPSRRGTPMDIVSTRQKVGLVLAALINLSSIPSVLFPAPDGEEGPPMAVLVVSTILGVIGLV